MSLSAASQYARAFVDVLSGPSAGVSGDDALAQLRAFLALRAESSELGHALESPAVPASKKRAVTARLGEMIGLAPIVRNFLFVLIDHQRLNFLAEVIQLVESGLDERRGAVRTLVTSAHALDDSERAEIEASLARLTGKTVIGNYAVDDSLIGGIVARVGSRVYDGSVRGRLEAMRSRLVGS